MNLIDETRRAFEEYMQVAHEGLSRHDYFTEESVKALMRSLQGRKEALRATLHGESNNFSHRGGIVEGY